MFPVAEAAWAEAGVGKPPGSGLGLQDRLVAATEWVRKWEAYQSSDGAGILLSNICILPRRLRGILRSWTQVWICQMAVE